MEQSQGKALPLLHVRDRMLFQLFYRQIDNKIRAPISFLLNIVNDRKFSVNRVYEKKMVFTMIPMSNDLATSKGKKSGQIQVIFGPMFSGKTTELMRRIKRYQFANHTCLVIKYANDSRYDKENLSTHDRITLSAETAYELTPILARQDLDQFSVIGIDEGQFFPDTVEFAEKMANMGKIVIVAALDASYQRLAFGNILQLVPLAESVIKLNAVCMKCFSENASFTQRKGCETETVIIGGKEKYLSVCRQCYFQEDEKKVANKHSFEIPKDALSVHINQ